ncbi:hypothetical protein Tco_0475423 [Tanacetum coccineum]
MCHNSAYFYKFSTNCVLCLGQNHAPRKLRETVRKIVEKRVAKAIEKYEKTRADSNNTGGSGSTNTRGTVAPEMHGWDLKVQSEHRNVGSKRWSKCLKFANVPEDDKLTTIVSMNWPDLSLIGAYRKEED